MYAPHFVKELWRRPKNIYPPAVIEIPCQKHAYLAPNILLIPLYKINKELPSQTEISPSRGRLSFLTPT